MNNALSIPEEDFEAAEKAKLIAEHNDRFRNTWGADFTIPGHCFGAVEITVGGETKTIWFKIDLYDLNLEYGAEDPTDLEQTKRVMTVLFPSDY